MVTIFMCNNFLKTIGNNMIRRGLITTSMSSSIYYANPRNSVLSTRHVLLNSKINSSLQLPQISTSFLFTNNIQDRIENHGIRKLMYFTDARASHDAEEVPKLGLVARFKKMYKDYWYVLLPVYVLTSACWYGGFFYASKSGVDIVGILESYNVSAKLTDSLRDSSMGHLAIAYILYKIATPARYTLTLGGTTMSIKYLVKWGYIKPVPAGNNLVKMYQKKKDNFQKLAERKSSFNDA